MNGKIYELIVILRKLSDEAVESGFIDGHEDALLQWHIETLEQTLETCKEATCQQQKKG